MISIAMNTPFYRPLEKQGGQLNYFISEEGLGQWELLWCIANPTNDELLGFQEGKIECRLAVVETISFFWCCKNMFCPNWICLFYALVFVLSN